MIIDAVCNQGSPWITATLPDGIVYIHENGVSFNELFRTVMNRDLSPSENVRFVIPRDTVIAGKNGSPGLVIEDTINGRRITGKLEIVNHGNILGGGGRGGKGAMIMPTPWLHLDGAFPKQKINRVTAEPGQDGGTGVVARRNVTIENFGTVAGGGGGGGGSGAWFGGFSEGDGNRIMLGFAPDFYILDDSQPMSLNFTINTSPTPDFTNNVTMLKVNTPYYIHVNIANIPNDRSIHLVGYKTMKGDAMVNDFPTSVHRYPDVQSKQFTITDRSWQGKDIEITAMVSSHDSDDTALIFKPLDWLNVTKRYLVLPAEEVPVPRGDPGFVITSHPPSIGVKRGNESLLMVGRTYYINIQYDYELNHGRDVTYKYRMIVDGETIENWPIKETRYNGDNIDIYNAGQRFILNDWNLAGKTIVVQVGEQTYNDWYWSERVYTVTSQEAPITPEPPGRKRPNIDPPKTGGGFDDDRQRGNTRLIDGDGD